MNYGRLSEAASKSVSSLPPELNYILSRRTVHQVNSLYRRKEEYTFIQSEIDDDDDGNTFS